jgi:16S rRNA (cytidine1402-2'-O)-methyltransferase
MSKLSVVATPIGNLEDITLRAIRILKEASVIACEDTRMTRKLLMHFNINAPLVSFHSNSGTRGIEKILTLLEEEKNIALVSDAGTPGISDPGLELISRVREKFGDSVFIEAIPGPSALTAAISISGLRAAAFTFLGFLPLKKGREKLFAEMLTNERATVFYESPHRIEKTLTRLAELLPSSRRIGIFRELTKIHEESIVGHPSEVLAALQSHPEKWRGEFVVIVEACSSGRIDSTEE